MNQKKEDFNRQFNNWVSKEKTAVNLLNVVGTLMYDKGIELVLFRRHLLDSNVSQLLNLFSYAKNVIDRETDVETALLLSKELLNLNLPPSKLDIGLLTAEYIESKEATFKFMNFRCSRLDIRNRT